MKMSELTHLVGMTEEDLVDLNLLVVDSMLQSKRDGVYDAERMDMMLRLATLLSNKLSSIRGVKTQKTQ